MYEHWEEVPVPLDVSFLGIKRIFRLKRDQRLIRLIQKSDGGWSYFPGHAKSRLTDAEIGEGFSLAGTIDQENTVISGHIHLESSDKSPERNSNDVE